MAACAVPRARHSASANPFCENSTVLAVNDFFKSSHVSRGSPYVLAAPDVLQLLMVLMKDKTRYLLPM
jgi:hypothetical protein